MVLRSTLKLFAIAILTAVVIVSVGFSVLGIVLEFLGALCILILFDEPGGNGSNPDSRWPTAP